MLIIKVLSGLAFMGSVAWYAAQPGYEPAIAIVTSLSAFIAVWLSDRKMKRQAGQSQTVAENGVGIQAGGDVSVGSIHSIEKTKNAE
ncbi:hypothetical protein [Rhodoferax saidenbachensis]|jgi:hypothetical protein|uniref:Uncharacterized protein n=1 Tax=Rhodoferax saidenbachensis TaxID=1484693 RepID=A0A1P8K9B5_9BURK|nr:hypothetical protein [Rhodoferax saidenbachensis]APW42604.1 hypothetical protein RS694_08720 [Rhodoferax saidenbachensis]